MPPVWGLQGGIAIAEPLILNGTGVGNVGALYNLSGANQYTGPIALGSASTIGNASGSLTVSGAIANLGFDLSFDSSNNIIASGINSGTGGLIQSGAGVTTLSGSNAYTGTTTVNAGTLTYGAPAGIPGASVVSVASGATLNVNGLSVTRTADSIISGTLALGTNGSVTLSGGSHSIAAITGSGTITVNSGASLTLTSNISNAGLTIVLAGGTLFIPGGTSSNLGTLSVGSSTGSTTSVIDMSSSGNASLTVSTLTLASNLLKVTNWTRGSDYLYANTFSGASRNVAGSAPMNRITMNNNASAYTIWQSDDQITVVNPQVHIAKQSNGGVGSFSFALNGLSATTVTITTTSAGVSVQSSTVYTGTAGQVATITESAAPTGWSITPISASCVDANGASDGNGTGVLGSLSGSTLTIPAANMVAGADLTCTIVNQLNGLTGTVFNDGGAPSGTSNTGTPNDGIQNGNEAGISGQTISLTDCGSTSYGSTSTDGNGHWTLSIPSTVSSGSNLCLTASVPSTYLATGANANGSALPSGSGTSVSGTSYTYTRSSQQISFTAPASGIATLNFGLVPVSTLTSNGTQQGLAGTHVLYAHTFTAGTGGSLSLSTSDTSTPAVSGWSTLLYTDSGCTGTRQANASLISSAVTVVQGEVYCFISQVSIPAAAVNGNSNATEITASLSFSNATPSLSASYMNTDTTTAGSSALSLLKEVRNVTTGGSFGTTNKAKSGDILEYRITYTNNGASPMTQVVISDSTPSYTTFQSASAGTTPTALGNCTKITPQSATAVSCGSTQATGGTGGIQWEFDGSLNPAATGDVLFRAKVD